MDNTRKYIAISIKHTEYKWKFGKPLVLWGWKRTADDEKRCFGGYTEDVNKAELYSLEEFNNHYGYPTNKEDAVTMCADFCKKYKEFDTVLMLESDYLAYCKVCGF